MGVVIVFVLCRWWWLTSGLPLPLQVGGAVYTYL
jgi:hypothetical protein